MSLSPIEQLKRIIGGGDPQSVGIVSSVQGDVVLVQTMQGLVEASSAVQVKVGDSVILNRGVVVGRRADLSSVPMFEV